jgi:BlaI family penicillinase repressor
MTQLFKPTESELEILSILWDKQTATVREVHEIVQQSKNIGYTTTLKLMQIMHEKGMVSRDESSKTHLYTPCFNKEKAQEQYLGKMIKTLFSGSASELVLQALGNNQTSKDELIAIKHLIETLEKNAKK